MVEFKAFAISPEVSNQFLFCCFSLMQFFLFCFQHRYPSEKYKLHTYYEIVSVATGSPQEHLEMFFAFTFIFLYTFPKNSSYVSFQKSLVVKWQVVLLFISLKKRRMWTNKYGSLILGENIITFLLDPIKSQVWKQNPKNTVYPS